MNPVHATTVARYGPAGWRGVMLTGPSGAGKSDLALRLIGDGWRLVADDYTRVWASGGALYATAPERIAGRIEIRGLGILDCLPRRLVRVALIADCGHRDVERLPEPETATLAGILVPRLAIDARPASAARLVAAALTHL